MTLWQKESSKKDALYVDIFKNHNANELKMMYYQMNLLKNKMTENAATGKSKEGAIKGRIAGNVIFAQKKYCAAIEQYNVALCFAEDGSEEMGLLYGNRSACFFELNMFDKCLIDIELAKKSNFPLRLMDKLNKRQTDCDESIAKGRLVKGYEPKLSYDANEQIPVLADAVNIDIDEHRRRRVIATKDLRVGDVILSEPLYVGQALCGEYTSCNICLKEKVNLIPCKRCIRALFCYGECENNTIHRLECDIRDMSVQTSLHETNCFYSIIRTILMAIELFPTIDDLMEFVERNVSNELLDVPKFTDDKAKYRTFLHLPLGPVTPVTIQLVYSVYHKMLDNLDIAVLFTTDKYRRFLMHLILCHDLALKESALVLGKDVAESTKTGQRMAYYYGLTYRLFNHSCAPNAMVLFCSGSSYAVIIRPLKEGEELLITLIGKTSELSYHDRQRLLMDRGIQCACELCVQRLNPLPKDPVFMNHIEYLTLIMRSSGYVCQQVTERSAKIAKEDIESFLQKYGRRPLCEEIQFITSIYEHVLVIIYSDKFHE